MQYPTNSFFTLKNLAKRNDIASAFTVTSHAVSRVPLTGGPSHCGWQNICGWRASRVFCRNASLFAFILLTYTIRITFYIGVWYIIHCADSSCYVHHNVIITQPVWPVIGRRPQHAVSKLPCIVLSSAIIVSSQYLSRSSLHRWAGLPCHLFLSCGLQVVTRKVHRLSLRWLICTSPFHFSHSVHYI